MIALLLAGVLLQLAAGVARAQSCTNNIISATVSSTGDALNLSEALLSACTGVQYRVEWTGRVTIPATLNVTSGNFLTITGSSAETAILDGEWDVQLFVLERNTTLILENVSLMRGKAIESGAAVYGPEECSLSAVNCSFRDNLAAESGGVIYVGDSEVTFSGATVFTNNTALELSGGGVFAIDSSVTISGNATFSNNSAPGAGGGAVKILDSSVTIDGEAFFLENSADESGGAIDIGGSEIMIFGDTHFGGNLALSGGGAVDVYDSMLYVDGNVYCAGNLAGEDGGAIYIHGESTVNVTGAVWLVGNVGGTEAPERGGGMYVLRSTVVIGGGANMINNVGFDGGGLAAYESSVIIEEGAAFTGNTAEADGGAIFAHGANVTIVGESSFVDNSAGIYGGAIYADDGAVVVVEDGTDAEFEGNTAGVDDDDIYTDDGIVKVNGLVYGDTSGAERSTSRKISLLVPLLILPGAHFAMFS